MYPEEINYTKLEESTDYVLWNLSEHVNTEVSDFAANKIDLEILSNLDSKYIQAYNDVKINPSIEAPDIVDCLNFFLANGEINGYKFTQLTDTGKKLALVSYDRFRDLAQTFISYYENSEIATNGEIPSVFRTADGMNTLSIATYLEANRLISGYYEFIRGCTDSMGIVSFNVDGELEYQINKIESENKAKGFKGNLNKIKSMFLVNYLKDLNVQTTINSFNQTININEEFENAEYYLDSVLKHNATYDVSKNISLVNVCHETDRYDIAYLESFYRTMKYEIETNQVNKEHVSSILRWVLEYYQGTYLDNPGVEVRYVDHLTNGGMLVASNILNQYKILIKNLDTQDPTIKDLIERIDNISLWQECKASEQWIYTYYEQLQPNLNYYTVKKGDTLSNIARMYNVNIFELVRLNNIENPDLILPGEKLKINPQYNYDEEFSR